jgi:hypothetical protein
LAIHTIKRLYPRGHRCKDSLFYTATKGNSLHQMNLSNTANRVILRKI